MRKYKSCLKTFTDAQSARTFHGMSVPKENKATETQLTIAADRIFLSFFVLLLFGFNLRDKIYTCIFKIKKLR